MSYDIKSHPLTININLLSKHESNVWQNPNDPDDENEHFKQPLIAIELESFSFQQGLNPLKPGGNKKVTDT